MVISLSVSNLNDFQVIFDPLRSNSFVPKEDFAIHPIRNFRNVNDQSMT